MFDWICFADIYAGKDFFSSPLFSELLCHSDLRELEELIIHYTTYFLFTKWTQNTIAIWTKEYIKNVALCNKIDVWNPGILRSHHMKYVINIEGKCWFVMLSCLNAYFSHNEYLSDILAHFFHVCITFNKKIDQNLKMSGQGTTFFISFKARGGSGVKKTNLAYIKVQLVIELLLFTESQNLCL